MEGQDDDVPQLSAETFSALQEFYKEQEHKEQIINELSSSSNICSDTPNISEDWQLSQFWYDEETALSLAKEIVRLSGTLGKEVSVACVSCPTLYLAIMKNFPQTKFKVKLFEYDKRFASVAGDDFVYYDYKNPMSFGQMTNNSEVCLREYFDVVIADPPFLSEECMTKSSVTVKYLAKKDAKLLFCTGATMKELLERLLNLHCCEFLPKHKNNLANEFRCYANYDFDHGIAELNKC